MSRSVDPAHARKPATRRQRATEGGDTAASDQPELPFVDAYSIEAEASPEHVWDVIVGRVLPRFGGGFGPVATGRIGQIGAHILAAPYAHPGASADAAPPASAAATAGAATATCKGSDAVARAAGGARVPSVITGFRVERAERPTLVALVGEHRFARYSLTLRVAPGTSESMSRLSAETRAVFRGTPGRWYRVAVIGSGAHRLVVSRLLERIRRLTERG